MYIYVYIHTHKYMNYPLIFEGDLVDKILILAFFFCDFFKKVKFYWNAVAFLLFLNINLFILIGG